MADPELATLRDKLDQLLRLLQAAIAQSMTDAEKKRILAATNLPTMTIACIDAYRQGDRHTPKESFFE